MIMGYSFTDDVCKNINMYIDSLPKEDPVNHPKHYTSHPSGVECIQITEHYGFNIGNCIKYLWRAGLKNDMIEDLKKAQWYLNREISKREKVEKNANCKEQTETLAEASRRSELSGQRTSRLPEDKSTSRPQAEVGKSTVQHEAPAGLSGSWTPNARSDIQRNDNSTINSASAGRGVEAVLHNGIGGRGEPASTIHQSDYMIPALTTASIAALTTDQIDMYNHSTVHGGTIIDRAKPDLAWNIATNNIMRNTK